MLHYRNGHVSDHKTLHEVSYERQFFCSTMPLPPPEELSYFPKPDQHEPPQAVIHYRAQAFLELTIMEDRDEEVLRRVRENRTPIGMDVGCNLPEGQVYTGQQMARVTFKALERTCAFLSLNDLPIVVRAFQQPIASEFMDEIYGAFLCVALFDVKVK